MRVLGETLVVLAYISSGGVLLITPSVVGGTAHITTACSLAVDFIEISGKLLLICEAISPFSLAPEGPSKSERYDTS